MAQCHGVFSLVPKMIFSMHNKRLAQLANPLIFMVGDTGIEPVPPAV